MNKVFGPLKARARSGDSVRCGDNQTWIIHPGMPFTSLDGEEGCLIRSTRAALTNYPCPKCLVHHNDLHNIDGNFELHSSESMKQVYYDAINAPNKTEAKRILKGVGIHKTEVQCFVTCDYYCYSLLLAEFLLVDGEFRPLFVILLWQATFWWWRQVGKAWLAPRTQCSWANKAERSSNTKVCLPDTIFYYRPPSPMSVCPEYPDGETLNISTMLRLWNIQMVRHSSTFSR